MGAPLLEVEAKNGISSMQVKNVTAKYHISGHITFNKVQSIADRGFRKIICNLPDGEIPDVDDSARILEAAEHFGLDYVYMPIVMTKITPQIVLQHTKEVIETNGAVLAYCATGRRSLAMWALEFSDKYSIDHILSIADSVGFDLASMRQKLETFQPLPSGVRL